jgi:hypothetical protein
MSNFTPKTYTTGQTFAAADETEVEREIEEQENYDATQDTNINARQPSDADLTALAAASSDGYWKRESGVWVSKTAIPKTDLASAVQISLGLADAAVQLHTGTSKFQEWESTISTAIDTGWVAIPTAVIGLWLSMIQPGNGGGSGRRGAAGSVRCGGGGGGGGGIIRSLFISTVALAATEYRLILPRPGTGGAAVTANDTDGNPGTLPTGGASAAGAWYAQFQMRDATTAIVYNAYIWPGSNGVGGTSGAAMATGSGGYALSIIGGAGSGNSLTGGTGIGGSNGIGALGGGQGGGVTSANVAGNGGPGGWNPAVTTALPVGGIVGGASPTDGSDSKMAGRPGNGGSGGAASITTAAQAGRTPVGYGGGGGGGGASLNGNASGAGANGAPGYASVEWIYG